MSSSQITFRKAVLEDWEGIRTIRDQVWAEDPCDPANVRKVLGDSSHEVNVALQDNTFCGFVDGFVTRSENGILRWEVDLLGVHPDFRGRSLGKNLIKASLEAGKTRDCIVARALIHVDNRSSQGAFTGCGFKDIKEDRVLYTCPIGKSIPETVLSQEGYLLKVTTINYRGIWVEEEFTQGAFNNALSLAKSSGLDLVGAVLPRDDFQAVLDATVAGLHCVGTYHWWNINL